MTQTSNINPSILLRASTIFMLIVVLAIMPARLKADTGPCGGGSVTLPFTDVPAANVFFCSIAAAFFSGLTNGTSATTYSPSANVPREQMAAFITRTMDLSIKRSRVRAALDQWWTPASFSDLQLAAVGTSPELCKSDGANIWVPNLTSGTVTRVSRVTGKETGTWTGVVSAWGVLVAQGQVFVSSPQGNLYAIDPSSVPGPVGAPLASGLGVNAHGIAFDGSRIWVASLGSGTGSVSVVSLNPVSVQTFTTGFSMPEGVVFDGTNIWVTDTGDEKFKKLNPDGSFALSLTLPGATDPQYPAFDGTNLWVPAQSGKLYIVRAVGGLAGTVLATLTGNGLQNCHAAAFDGERILVTNNSVGGSVSLWKASDLTPLGSFADPAYVPFGVCSDGINFWITLHPSAGGAGSLARF